MKSLPLLFVFLGFFPILNAQQLNSTLTDSIGRQSDSMISWHNVPQKSMESMRAMEKMAEFRGGMNKLYTFIAKKVNYPYRCMEAGIEGMVMLEFVVEADGSLTNIKTRTSHKSCPEMDAEAIRVIKKTSGKWTPAYQGDKPVRSMYRLPVRFDLG